MQVEIIQQAQQQHTQSIPQAMEYLQELPTSMREEVFHFIDFMRMRSLNEVQQESETPVKKRHAGTAKGKAIFTDDFDEPLEDFKDYM